MFSIAGSLFDLIRRYMDAQVDADRQELGNALQKELETTLMAERLKFDSFRELYTERASLYREIWKRIDLVSFDRWTPDNEGVPKDILKERVLFLRHYLVDLNEEKGYIVDPVSRKFLLDLRWWSKKCADENKGDRIKWLYEYRTNDPKHAHGIKLWMLKSGLRRSMVRSLHLPEAGDPSYFDQDTMQSIVEGISNTIEQDLQRFLGTSLDMKKVKDIIKALFPPAPTAGET